jgi:hypothetical protein
MHRFSVNTIKIIMLIIITTNSSGIFAQRFTDRTADSIKITDKVLYAITEDFIGRETRLYFDLYEPADDSIIYRPLVITVFGGSFVVGRRNWIDMQAFGDSLAHYGYVVASIDYRLGYNPVLSGEITRAAYRATQDINAAIRYFKANYKTHGIDTTNIFLLGSSAGSIASLTSAFLDEEERPDITYAQDNNLNDLGCINCSGGYNNHTNSVAGVIALWGGMNNPAYIDSNDSIPVCFIHGKKDNTIPYDKGHVYKAQFMPYIFGAAYLSNYMDSLGVWNELHLFPVEKHGFYLKAKLIIDPQKFDTCLNIIVNFMSKMNPFVNNPDKDILFTGNPVSQKTVNLYRKDHFLLLDYSVFPNDNFYRISMPDGRAIKSGHTFLNRGIDMKYIENGIYILEIYNNKDNAINKILFN